MPASSGAGDTRKIQAPFSVLRSMSSRKEMTMRKLIRGLIPALLLTALPLASEAAVAVGVSIAIGPPALPIYVQPPCPAPGHMWIPGYWAWGEDDYYWV